MTTRPFSFSPGPDDHPGISDDSATQPPVQPSVPPRPTEAPPLSRPTRPPLPVREAHVYEAQMPREPARDAPVPQAPVQGAPVGEAHVREAPVPEEPVRDGPDAEPEKPLSGSVDGLVHAAVADRPLEEIVRLITLLEESPEYARATVDALRAVGVSRSVEDVTRLVVLLTRPPRDPESADEAIRAAAEHRPVEDVTRLMTLLHRSQLDPRCGREALRAAASRPVEELVQLIGRLEEEQELNSPTYGSGTLRQHAAEEAAADGDGDRSGELPGNLPKGLAAELATAGRKPGGRRRTPRAARPRRTGSVPAWPSWLAAGALLLCGLSYLPLHRGGATAAAYGIDLGVLGMCLVLAIALVLNGGLPVLAACVVVPAALAALQLFAGRLHSTSLSRALDLAAAPSWFAGLMAVLAALASLTALLAVLASEKLARHPEQAGAPAPAGRPAD
ncbi:hypothetical protein [Streptomyces sp. NPDC059786]|uniref:hypothetical protein n=1 Tax=Streptomyces sp. NPDC059786 TaxID=3346946 RepID=UPI003660C429